MSTPNDDPFAALDLPRRFDLDPKKLHSRFIQAQAKAHPDRFDDPVAQADAAEQSARINHAHETLRDPERRANALLTLIGGPDKQDDRSLPPALLMEMMEAREAMDDALERGDDEAIAKSAKWARDGRGKHLARIAELFDQAAQAGDEQRADLHKEVRLELNTLRYFQRMIDQTPAG